MIEQLIKRLNELIQALIASITSEDGPDIDLTNDYEPGVGFRLYVGTEGIVKAITWRGTTIERKFIVGYHVIKLKKVFSTANGTTAADLGAIF